MSQTSHGLELHWSVAGQVRIGPWRDPKLDLTFTSQVLDLFTYLDYLGLSWIYIRSYLIRFCLCRSMSMIFVQRFCLDLINLDLHKNTAQEKSLTVLWSTLIAQRFLISSGFWRKITLSHLSKSMFCRFSRRLHHTTSKYHVVEAESNPVIYTNPNVKTRKSCISYAIDKKARLLKIKCSQAIFNDSHYSGHDFSNSL